MPRLTLTRPLVAEAAPIVNPPPPLGALFNDSGGAAEANPWLEKWAAAGWPGNDDPNPPLLAEPMPMPEVLALVVAPKLNPVCGALAFEPNANGVGVVDGGGAEPNANEDAGAGNPGMALLLIEGAGKELLNEEAGEAAGAPNPVAAGAPKPDDGGGNAAAGVGVLRNENPVEGAGAAGNVDGKDVDAGKAGALLAMAENEDAGAGVLVAKGAAESPALLPDELSVSVGAGV